MIQSNKPFLYDARNGEKWAIVLIEVTSWTVTGFGITYSVCDYAIANNTREFIGSKEVTRSWEQLNSLNVYLETVNDYSGMNKKDREFAKVRHGLLLETQTMPLYGSTAQDWVLTENNEV